jgi:hypothetical protein
LENPIGFVTFGDSFLKQKIMQKKSLFLAILLLSVSSAYAQLVVNADGSTTFAFFKTDGAFAGFTGSPSTPNASFGYNALNSSILSMSYGENVAFGLNVLSALTTGFGNTAVGSNALRFTTDGYFNTASGHRALYSNTSGYGNTAAGIESLYSNTEGYENTATGGGSLYANTTGNSNSSFGYYSMPSNTTGSLNSANGDGALPDNTTGSYNTGMGIWSLRYNTTGSYNSALGAFSFVGSDNLNNSTALGYQAALTSSNQVRIGDTNVNSIGGYAGWTNVSDGRIKKNIQTNVPGLSFINQLQPITYNLDLDAMDGLLKIDRTKKRPGEEAVSPELAAITQKAKEAKEKQIQTGFIAQDVEKSAQSLGYDFSGVDVDEVGIYGLRYAEFVVPLVKAVQELSAQVNELTELVQILQGKDAAPALRSGGTGEAAQELAISGASLQQNSPNPFGQSTVIRYTLPKTDKPAFIVISNTAGNIIRQIPLQAGTDSITVEGGALSAGIYYYSLYVENGLVDTKKMVLTK